MKNIISPVNGGTGNIGTTQIADLAVTTPKIDNLAVTAGKIADNTIDATALNAKFATGAKPMRYRGAPMMNSLIMLGAPGPILAGDTVTIGADVYEFRPAATPPVGGTGGRIWVSRGADSAASRANFIQAVNGDGGPLTTNVVARGDGIGANPGTNTVAVFARAGTTLGTVDVLSASQVGTEADPTVVGDIAPSAVASATTEVLTTGTDVWNDITMYGGNVEAIQSIARAEVVITTNMITAGFVEVPFTFTPLFAVVTCRTYPAVYSAAWTIVGNQVRIALAAGGHAAGQLVNTDVVEVVAFGA